jgi:hypothetical protein
MFLYLGASVFKFIVYNELKSCAYQLGKEYIKYHSKKVIAKTTDVVVSNCEKSVAYHQMKTDFIRSTGYWI